MRHQGVRFRCWARGHSLQATVVSHNTNIHACEGAGLCSDKGSDRRTDAIPLRQNAESRVALNPCGANPGEWQMSLNFLHQMLSDRSVVADTISFGSGISGCGRLSG